jgi:hypothetical protein
MSPPIVRQLGPEAIRVLVAPAHPMFVLDIGQVCVPNRDTRQAWLIVDTSYVTCSGRLAVRRVHQPCSDAQTACT